MKKVTAFIVILSCIMSTATVWATPTGFSGGVNNEYQYEEIVFISGEPIKFVGEIDIRESERKDTKTITYKISNLKPEDTSISGDLDRTLTVVTEYAERTDKGQTIADTSITRYTETIQIGNDRYVLSDMQFSKSDVIDNRPAADFYSGTIKARKYYTINRDEGSVIVDISGGDVGYQNFWGNTETQVLDYNIIYDRQMEVEGEDGEGDSTQSISWQGAVKVQNSDSTTKVLSYAENEANFSSFNGGYMRVTKGEMVSKYDYDLPRMDTSETGYAVTSAKTALPHATRRLKDDIQLSKTMVPKVERLVVPKFRDTGGHWAQGYIERLYSLDVFDGSSQFFTPEVAMTRQEFTKGVIKACDIRPTLVEKKTSSRRRNQPPEESLFNDVDVEDSDYEYIKQAVEKGIITGTSNGFFSPGDPLTRAQAITILIRALGFENKAPTPGYYTSFSDDRKIPEWAKDCIYVASEFGLVTGDEYNNINPNKVMTRAEASAMLVRFLEFLEGDLQTDYRENIIYFN
ncbi:S-layer homology domain-containing protein [Petroclostridium sp. X23]|uniref:S-layer homology domain-containing protein n=1 Tax=Petroclostridium sp. X23 TaxID=3045146 RepID=UPI0024AE193D|nr:S-layer homology domain-containing protein [Petroclostridium sp. X23]WHH57375.1 S-layer homology domain-containing protein [Petroclostridium sp. X23]